MGARASFDSRDRSFTSTEGVADGEVELTFVAQSGGRSAELLITHRSAKGAEGSNFAALARRITELQGGSDPHPPYPRPNISSAESLAEVLGFGLEIQREVAGELGR